MHRAKAIRRWTLFSLPVQGADVTSLIPDGRVRKRRCRRSLPSEPDMKVSLHPAQAAAKPRYRGAGSLDGFNPAS